jgi:hypothetical protein
MAKATFAAPITPRTAERGAALVVGLVLLLVLTVLGISGMNTATLELVMANNMQQQQLAFQAAETGIDLAIGNGTYLTSVPTNFVGGPARSVMNCVATTNVPDIGFSMGVPAGGAQAYHFDVVAVGTGPRNAISTHNQSFYVVGPGSPVGC